MRYLYNDDLAAKIESEGFDYFFGSYASEGSLPEDLGLLYTTYRSARRDLITYLHYKGLDVGEIVENEQEVFDLAKSVLGFVSENPYVSLTKLYTEAAKENPDISQTLIRSVIWDLLENRVLGVNPENKVYVRHQ